MQADCTNSRGKLEDVVHVALENGKKQGKNTKSKKFYIKAKKIIWKCAQNKDIIWVSMRENDESANTILYLGRIYHEITQKSSSSRYGVHNGIHHSRMRLQDNRNYGSSGRDDSSCSRNHSSRRDDSGSSRNEGS